MEPSELLVGLDPDQRLAVASPSPLLAVIAGAGSGKTSVLTRRVAHRIATDAVDARHVVALTFTRQAASELRRRLWRLGVREQVAAGTFHATALGLLRQHWADRGLRTPTVTSERSRLVAEVVGARQRNVTREVSTEIDWARARLVGPESYAAVARRRGRRTTSSAGAIAEWYRAYEDLKRTRGVLDLDDLLSHALHLMRDDRSFAEVAHWRFRHLFVDEAQDLNPLQSAVLDAWRDGRDDLTLVGDPSQAIYGFNGADPGLLLTPERHFPGIEVVRLGTNYRCAPPIVAAGVSVLSHAGPAPSLTSARVGGEPVRVLGFADLAAEAHAIAQIVREMRRPGGRWAAVAVLARTNAQLVAVADALRASGIPNRTPGASRSSSPLQRAVQEAAEQVTDHQLAMWAVDAAHPDTDAGHAEMAEITMRRKVAAAVHEYLALGGGDGRGFLSWVRATDPFSDGDDGDAVELLTFHAAKGREWSRVVIAGASTGLVPHGSATTDAEHAEEVRLLYVALTRGADEVVVTWHGSRDGRRCQLSPLLDGIAADPEPAVPPPVQPVRPTREPEDVTLVALRAWRDRAARAASMSPSAFLSDATLAAIVDARPSTVDELGAIRGVGAMLARQLGPRILDVLATTSPAG